MRGITYREILLVFIFSLLIPASVQPENRLKKEAQEANKGPIVIKSQSLELDNKKRVVVFMGQVEAKREDMAINCEKMLVYYTGKSTELTSENADMRIDRIVATGKVKITRPDGIFATADKLVYYENGEKVVLTGKPVVKQGNDFVEGSRITLYLTEERSVVEGSEKEKVRAVLHPRSDKRD